MFIHFLFGPSGGVLKSASVSDCLLHLWNEEKWEVEKVEKLKRSSACLPLLESRGDHRWLRGPATPFGRELALLVLSFSPSFHVLNWVNLLPMAIGDESYLFLGIGAMQPSATRLATFFPALVAYG